MKDIIIIAAVAKNGVIGCNGRIPWHIGDDFRRFKELTMGHTVIMGLKTWESLPKRPLEGRKNIVLSWDPYTAEGAVVAGSLKEAFALAGDDDKLFVIGGASVYAEAMASATVLELTRLEKEAEGDVLFPAFDDKLWALVKKEEKNDPGHGRYAFCTYRRNETR